MLSPSGVGFMVVYMQVFGDTLGQQSKKFRTFLFANCRKKYQYEKDYLFGFFDVSYFINDYFMSWR